MDQIVRFVREAYQELKLSSWLTVQQMVQSTVVVIVITLILAVYVSVIDRILLWVAGILFRIA